MTPEEEHAFYSDPENLMPQGPAHRRNARIEPEELEGEFDPEEEFEFEGTPEDLAGALFKERE